MVVYAFLKWLWKRLVHTITAVFKNFDVRQDIFESDDEILAKMLCVVVQGRDAANAQFRLRTNRRDTPLRVKRVDGTDFWQDPIYTEIDKALDRLAPAIAEDPNSKSQNPFLNPLTRELEAEAIAVSHPLGGCRMAKSATDGVVDEYGHVFDKTKSGQRPFYEGLYIADGSIIPTALGINPSLTIAALSLRIAAKIIQEL